MALASLTALVPHVLTALCVSPAAEFVLWAPDGSTYAVGVQGRCDVYSVASAGVLHSLKSAGRINCAAYLSVSVLG